MEHDEHLSRFELALRDTGIAACKIAGIQRLATFHPIPRTLLI